MITVSDMEKYVCVWGEPAREDDDVIKGCREKGYMVVRVSNGNGNIRECLKTVAKSNGII